MKNLLVNVQVMNGEYKYEIPVLYRTKAKDINIAAKNCAKNFYECFDYKVDCWYYFNAGEVATKVYSVKELTIEEYKLLSKLLYS